MDVLPKSQCSLCGKYVMRLNRHLKLVHKSTEVNIEPTSLKEFAQIILLFPLSPKQWTFINKYLKHIKYFTENDEKLPIDVFEMLYIAFEKYKESQNKLISYHPPNKKFAVKRKSTSEGDDSEPPTKMSKIDEGTKSEQ